MSQSTRAPELPQHRPLARTYRILPRRFTSFSVLVEHITILVYVLCGVTPGTYRVPRHFGSVILGFSAIICAIASTCPRSARATTTVVHSVSHKAPDQKHDRGRRDAYNTSNQMLIFSQRPCSGEVFFTVAHVARQSKTCNQGRDICSSYKTGEKALTKPHPQICLGLLARLHCSVLRSCLWRH